MLQMYITNFWLTKWSFLVPSTTRIAPYIHPRHDSNCDGLSRMKLTCAYGKDSRAGVIYGDISQAKN